MVEPFEHKDEGDLVQTLPRQLDFDVLLGQVPLEMVLFDLPEAKHVVVLAQLLLLYGF